MSDLISVADLGSNTFRMVTAREEGQGAIRLVDLRQKVVRLAEGVARSGEVSVKALRRAKECFGEFERALATLGEARRFCVLTAVGRMANNAGEVERLAREILGAQTLIPTGREEARLSYEGAVSLLSAKKENLLFLDIGGGSTEIVFSNGGEVIWEESVAAGIVTFWEQDRLGEKGKK
ncbi:hypothetical protein FDZ71_17880, partial [bacterium]